VRHGLTKRGPAHSLATACMQHALSAPYLSPSGTRAPSRCAEPPPAAPQRSPVVTASATASPPPPAAQPARAEAPGAGVRAYPFAAARPAAAAAGHATTPNAPPAPPAEEAPVVPPSPGFFFTDVCTLPLRLSPRPVLTPPLRDSLRGLADVVEDDCTRLARPCPAVPLCGAPDPLSLRAQVPLSLPLPLPEVAPAAPAGGEAVEARALSERVGQLGVANERLASEASEWERQAREAVEQRRLLIASVAEERQARAAEAGALRQEAARLQATLTDSEEHVRPPTAPLRLPGRWTRWTRRMRPVGCIRPC